MASAATDAAYAMLRNTEASSSLSGTRPGKKVKKLVYNSGNGQAVDVVPSPLDGDAPHDLLYTGISGEASALPSNFSS